MSTDMMTKPESANLHTLDCFNDFECTLRIKEAQFTIFYSIDDRNTVVAVMRRRRRLGWCKNFIITVATVFHARNEENKCI